MRPRRRRFQEKIVHKHLLTIFVIFVIILILIGTIIFKLHEHRSLLDALYFTIMTITTIGYGDVIPVTIGWKITAMLFAIIWVPIFIGIVWLIFEARIKKTMNKQMNLMEKEIEETEDRLEETENKLLQEKKKLNQLKKQEIQEHIEKKKWILKKIFKK